MSGPILGWKLDREDRARLLERFAPAYGETLADHVTHGRKRKAPPMPAVAEAVVVGRADDGEGVEALVVEVGGTTARWDGSRYHVTWSLAAGRAARESNEAIARHGWEPVAGRPTARLIATEWT